MVAGMRSFAMAVAMLGLASCADDDYQRPRTVEYITEAILIPSCAVAQCHSSFKQADGYSFGTLEQARHGIVDMVSGAIVEVDRGIPDRATFVNVLERTVDRMPYDQPLANADIELIRNFILIGAPHAQCSPANGELQCLGDAVHTCDADFNYSMVAVEDCAGLPPPSASEEFRCIDGACVAVDR